MEDNKQVVRRWARRGNLKQFLTDIRPLIEPLGYSAELNVDTVRCYRMVEKKSLMGLRKQVVKEPVMAVCRRNGAIEVEEADEQFLNVLAGVARAD